MLVALALFALMAGLATQTLFGTMQGYRHIRAAAQDRGALVAANNILRQVMMQSRSDALVIGEPDREDNRGDFPTRLWLDIDVQSHEERLQWRVRGGPDRSMLLAGHGYRLEVRQARDGRQMVVLTQVQLDDDRIRASSRAPASLVRNCRYDRASRHCLAGGL
ncbi:hypothetical protein [uncultured Maricaulis sp.]|uniref:PulJ/GspJ family protein n=1 Tax=uncultured Maricaulis sp. TaxID=174710 RepID=UPI0030D98E4E|tara:strand:- start:89267 stop:89755 length:489 start_codon:yes stop_codon:yes gene_type:complete